MEGVPHTLGSWTKQLGLLQHLYLHKSPTWTLHSNLVARLPTYGSGIQRHVSPGESQGVAFS